MRTSIREKFDSSQVILAEGAVIERLRRNPAVRLDPEILHAGLVLKKSGRTALERIYREYFDIGRKHNLPIMTFTPTWRANPERMSKSGASTTDLNGECAQFLRRIRSEYGPYERQILVGGLIGCRGDAYDPKDALLADEAREFHKEQIGRLAAAGVEFLCAATLPAMSEAHGIAQAMASSGLPFIISFITTPGGTLLDETPLSEAVAVIDANVSPPPLAYMVNCVHPLNFRSGFERELRRTPSLSRRVIGLQANTSALSPRELDGRPVLDEEDPDRFASAMLALRVDFGLKILGGCCGTDGRHIEALAGNLARR